MVLLLGQDRFDVITEDVSAVGASLKGPVSFPRGTMVVLETACPLGCPNPIRLVARVIRGAEDSTAPGAGVPTVGIAWVRAFNSGPDDHLAAFLCDTLGIPEQATLTLEHTPSGDPLYDFGSGLSRPPAAHRGDSVLEAQARSDRLRFLELQRGRYRVHDPVVYSINNVHHQGHLIALGSSGAAVSTRSALPFENTPVTIRYVSEKSGNQERFILHGNAEWLLDSLGKEPGVFSLRFTRIEEVKVGGFIRHIHDLRSQETPLW